MAKRTYNADDYEPETQAAMNAITDIQGLAILEGPSQGKAGHDFEWLRVEIADVIEKAVVEAKQVTEEKVRAACTAVAEAHLGNSKPETGQ